MPELSVGRLRFIFSEGWLISTFDKWQFYRSQFQNICGGTKAIDFLAVNPKVCCWMIEVKDYRRNPRTKLIDLPEEMAMKIRDSLASLAAARVRANRMEERNWAEAALKCPDLRVVLHLEQPTKHSKLFPRAIHPATVRQRLKQLLKAIDPHPMVVDLSNPWLPWSVSVSDE